MTTAAPGPWGGSFVASCGQAPRSARRIAARIMGSGHNTRLVREILDRAASRGSIRRTAAAAWFDSSAPGTRLRAATQFAWIQGGARGPQRTERGTEGGRRAQA